MFDCEERCSENEHRNNRHVLIRNDQPIKVNGEYGFITPLFFDLSEIEFKYSGGSGWYPEYESLLDSTIKEIKKHPIIKYQIEIHSDNRGSASYNQRISWRRAEAIKKHFTYNGIPEENLIAIGKGEDESLIDCNSSCTEEEHRFNRRIFLIPLNENSEKKDNFNGLVQQLATIEFDLENESWQEKYQLLLNSIKDILIEKPETIIFLEGIIDNDTNYQQNKLLTEKRTKNLEQYFIANGVQKNRFISLERDCNERVFRFDFDNKCSNEKFQMNGRVKIKFSSELIK